MCMYVLFRRFQTLVSNQKFRSRKRCPSRNRTAMRIPVSSMHSLVFECFIYTKLPLQVAQKSLLRLQCAQERVDAGLSLSQSITWELMAQFKLFQIKNKFLSHLPPKWYYAQETVNTVIVINQIHLKFFQLSQNLKRFDC